MDCLFNPDERDRLFDMAAVELAWQNFASAIVSVWFNDLCPTIDSDVLNAVAGLLHTSGKELVERCQRRYGFTPDVRIIEGHPISESTAYQGRDQLYPSQELQPYLGRGNYQAD